MTEPQKDALVDHELTHLVLVIDPKTKTPKLDHSGRPKLAMRLHDWELGGFADTAQHYGKDALEVISMRRFSDKYGQLCFDFEPLAKE